MLTKIDQFKKVNPDLISGDFICEYYEINNHVITIWEGGEVEIEDEDCQINCTVEELTKIIEISKIFEAKRREQTKEE